MKRTARLARSGEGMVVLFRNDSEAPSAEFGIPGCSDGSFEMIDWSSGKTIALQGNKMRTHIEIPFAAGETTAVFKIRRTDTTR